MATERLQRVLEGIDGANRKDPRRITAGTAEQPYEVLYSQWVTDWVGKLEPHPSEELLIAARGQHIRRWEIPRDSYPDDRKGYLAWRERLKQFHAEQVTELMREAGYPEESIQKTQRLTLKKNIRDPESQVLEDALCLVFLERQFTDLRKRESDEKMIEILRKSWRKMDEKGRAAALSLSLPPEEKDLVRRALSP